VAQRRYVRGLQYYDAGDFAHALEEFNASVSLYSSPNSRLYVARSLRRMGRVVDAASEYERTIAESENRAQHDSSFAQTRDAARNELAQIEPQLGRVALVGPALPSDARVGLAGRSLPPASLGFALPVPPGRVRIEITAPGYAPWSTEIPVGSGQTARVAVHLGPPRPIHHENYVMVRGDARPYRALGITSLAVGALGAAGYVTFYLLATRKFGMLTEMCGGIVRYCGDHQDMVDVGRTYELMANVGIGVGIGGAVLSAAMFVAGAIVGAPHRVRVVTGARSAGLEVAF
jgi:hypothetical protein